ncbi:MAG: DUF935 domain-containing protein [Clostridia bacterium]|nr:DUF935 domain-containing protein [Clostridia bacterium]
MGLISNIREVFSGRPVYTQNDVDRLVKFAKSRQGIKLTAELMRQTDSLTKKDVASWRQAWQAAISIDTPNRNMLYDIFTDCMVDCHLTGCIEQRMGETTSKKFILAGKDGKEDKKATEIFEREWFSTFIKLTLESLFWGHSLIQLGDVVNVGGMMRFTDVELVPRKHVVQEYGVVIRTISDDWHNGIPYREGDFADWCVEVGGPRELGLLNKCAPQCISKKNMLAFWDMFGELFGVPMRVARTNTSDESERRRIEKSLDNMGAAFWALFPEGTDIEIKESSRGDAYNVYDKRVDRCNSEMSKGVLGQTMTIDSGSSLSQSETHLEVFKNLVEQDATLVANIVNDRLLPLMLRHGFPLKGLRFKWDDTTEFTPAEDREIERMILQSYEIDPKYFIDKYGIPITGKRSAAPDPDSFFA